MATVETALDSISQLAKADAGRNQGAVEPGNNANCGTSKR
jgi:hypothetical protein